MKVFIEEQKFTQLWLITLIVTSALVPSTIILGTYIKNRSSFSITELILILSIVLLSCGIIFLFKLITRIDEKGIHYKFFPFHLKLKTITWQEVENAQLRTYDALSEYGGWGLKGGSFWKKSKGKAINISGNIGIQLELKNGKKLLIGTQKQQEVESVLKTYKEKIS